MRTLPAAILGPLLLLLQQPPGPDPETPAASLSTEHYEIQSADPDVALRVGAVAEETFALYERRFQALGRPQARLTIMVYPQAADVDREIGRGPRGYWGVYQPGAHRLILSADRTPREMRVVLLHEGFHQFLDAVAPHAPPWLHEGLAQYFQAHDIEDGHVRPGLIIASYVRMLRDVPTPDLHVVFAATMGQFHSAGQEQTMYAWAWLLAHALADSSTRTRAGFELLIAAFAAGETPDPFEALGPDLDRRVAEHLADLAARVAAFDAAYEEGQALEEAGDAEAASRSYRQATRLAREIDDTRRWNALFRRALIEDAAGRRDDALDLLDEVVASGVGWPAAHYQRALLRRARGDRDGATEDLREVLRTRPDYGPALRLLEELAGRP